MTTLAPNDNTKILYHITDIEWDFNNENDTNAKSLRNKLHNDLQKKYTANHISKSNMMKELDKFDKWLKTANIGDTHWDENSEGQLIGYTLKIADGNLPTSIDAQNINDTITDYLSNTYGYLVKSCKASIKIIDESKNNNKQ